MARHARVVTRGRPAPCTKIWIGAGLVSTTVVAGTPLLFGVLSAAVLLMRPFTLLRTRVVIGYESDQVAASERPVGVIGGIVVKEQATTAGVASLPTPLTEPDAEWFFYQSLMQSFLFRDSTGATPRSSRQYEIDSKSMRKVGQNEDIAFVVENRPAVGAVVFLEGRMLIQLH